MLFRSALWEMAKLEEEGTANCGSLERDTDLFIGAMEEVMKGNNKKRNRKPGTDSNHESDDEDDLSPQEGAFQ